jgi:hypothetical protein
MIRAVVVAEVATKIKFNRLARVIVAVPPAAHTNLNLWGSDKVGMNAGGCRGPTAPNELFCFLFLFILFCEKNPKG